MATLNKIGLFMFILGLDSWRSPKPIPQLIGTLFVIIGVALFLIPFETKIHIDVTGPFEVEEINKDAIKD